MKIKSIKIFNFRGIPNNLVVDFTDNNKKAVSTMISGDNGVGKSSILDAIEYNLQGRIYREPLRVTSESKMPVSLKYKPMIGCNTIVELDNGDINARGIDLVWKDNRTEFKIDNKFCHPSFAISPIILRRNDIISFSVIPKEKRQVLFFSFLYQNYIKLDDAIQNWIHWEGDMFLTTQKDAYIQLKSERKNIVAQLANAIGVKTESLPFSIDEKLKQFIISIKGKSFLNIGLRHSYNNTHKGRKDKKLYELYTDIVTKNAEISKVKKAIEKALNPDVYGVLVKERREQNANLIKSTEIMLTESFKKVSNLDFVDEINLELGEKTTASFEIKVKLKNGRWATPQQIFSEANFDLMVLLLYLSIIRVSVANGQSKVLILDDVLQSVDSVIRAKFMDYVLTVCHDWQIIVSCHDELWQKQMEYLFNLKGHKYKNIKIAKWDFETGPKVVYESLQSEASSLEKAISVGDKQIIASSAGLLLENICQKLSVSLSVRIHRKKDDKYTLGDLWPGIMKALKKSSLLSELLNNIDREMMVRNMLGCHANEWAQSMSDSEIMVFANNILNFYHSVYCSDCMSWISNGTCSGDYIAECRCRKIQYIK